MMEKAKIFVIFVLIAILGLLMYGYWTAAQGKPELIGGFIATLFYLVKKIADQVDDIIDKLWGIDKQQEVKDASNSSSGGDGSGNVGTGAGAGAGDAVK